VAPEARVQIRHESDIITARQQGRDLAVKVGFSGSEPTLIATAISEVARNILVYAKVGEIALAVVERSGKRGISVVATDEGPGIPNLEKALLDGFSTGGSLGLGLPGARRLMDEFQLESQVGKGTTVTMTKWIRG
jgi:serine/threonine-protein kinase RsbT